MTQLRWSEPEHSSPAEGGHLRQERQRQVHPGHGAAQDGKEDTGREGRPQQGVGTICIEHTALSTFNTLEIKTIRQQKNSCYFIHSNNLHIIQHVELSGMSFLCNNTTKQYLCREESVLMELKFPSDRWDNSDSSSGTFPFSPRLLASIQS